MSVHELNRKLKEGTPDLQVLDVRRDDEWQQGHIPTAQHTYVPFLEQELDRFDKHKHVAVYCGSGYRASIRQASPCVTKFISVPSPPPNMGLVAYSRCRCTIREACPESCSVPEASVSHAPVKQSLSREIEVLTQNLTRIKNRLEAACGGVKRGTRVPH